LSKQRCKDCLLSPPPFVQVISKAAQHYNLVIQILHGTECMHGTCSRLSQLAREWKWHCATYRIAYAANRA